MGLNFCNLFLKFLNRRGGKYYYLPLCIYRVAISANWEHDRGSLQSTSAEELSSIKSTNEQGNTTTKYYRLLAA